MPRISISTIQSRWTVFILLLAIVTLSGCQLGRLFVFKRQLNHVDKYVDLSKPNTIILTKPVLNADDAKLVSGAEPTSVTTTHNTTIWTFKMDRDRSRLKRIPPQLDMTFHIIFKQGLISEFRYPEEFSYLFPPVMVRYALLSISQGTYSNSGRGIVAKAATTKPPFAKTDLPTKTGLRLKLGDPNRRRFNKGIETWTYIYIYTHSANGITIISKPSIRVTFVKGSEHITSFTTDLLGPTMKFSLD